MAMSAAVFLVENSHLGSAIKWHDCIGVAELLMVVHITSCYHSVAARHVEEGFRTLCVQVVLNVSA